MAKRQRRDRTVELLKAQRKRDAKRASGESKGKAGQGGRPKGARDKLPRGVKAAVDAARQAEKLGINTEEARGIILKIMRGQITGRWVAVRLSAAVTLLEHEIGKARQKMEITDKREPLKDVQVNFVRGVDRHGEQQSDEELLN